MLLISWNTSAQDIRGVVREVLFRSRTLIFHKELYATASIIGGLIYAMLLFQFGEGDFLQVIIIISIIGIRFAAYHYKIGLPQLSYTISEDTPSE